LSEQLISVAKAEDGLTEAVYMPGKTFILAVQWHPEFTYHLDNYSIKLFIAFVDKCKKVSI
jgi:putative glutamine amidotransferase